MRHSDNEDLALLSGINPEQVVRLTRIIATALAVTAGTLYGLDKSFKGVQLFPDFCRSLPPPSWAGWAIRHCAVAGG